MFSLKTAAFHARAHRFGNGKATLGKILRSCLPAYTVEQTFPAVVYTEYYNEGSQTDEKEFYERNGLFILILFPHNTSF